MYCDWFTCMTYSRPSFAVAGVATDVAHYIFLSMVLFRSSETIEVPQRSGSYTLHSRRHLTKGARHRIPIGLYAVLSPLAERSGRVRRWDSINWRGEQIRSLSFRGHKETAEIVHLVHSVLPRAR